MGRGQRKSVGEKTANPSARKLLYGPRPSGPGPQIVNADIDLDQFSRLVAFHLAGEGYVKGIASEPGLNQNGDRAERSEEGRSFFDIFGRNGATVTRLEMKSSGRGNGLVLSRRQAHGGAVEVGDSLFNFYPGTREASDLDALEIDLLVKGQKIDLDYVERELTFTELEERLGNGQSLELVVSDEDNGAMAIHDYLTEMAERVAANNYEANNLVYGLGGVPLDQPERYLDIMIHDPLGREILAGRGIWRVRHYRR